MSQSDKLWGKNWTSCLLSPDLGAGLGRAWEPPSEQHSRLQWD